MNTENEIYTLATCPGTKYSGDTITLRATPRDGIGPYYVAFKKDGIIIDPSRLGAQPNPISDAPENIEITRTYTLNDEDVRNALTGTIGFSVFIRDSCPTGGGLQFNGVNNYVDAGNAASVNLGNTGTVSIWIKNVAQRNWEGVIGKGSMYSISQNYGGNGYYLYVRNIDSGNHYAFGSNSLPLGVWTLVTATWQKNTTLKIYYNGIISATGTLLDKDVIVDATPLKIGFSQEGNIYFNGTIDEVRIYNRALSPTEVLNNYNGYVSRDGLVLEHIYSLGNANDLSGYGNNGTPINGPVFIPNACIDTCTIPIGCVAPVCNFVVT